MTGLESLGSEQTRNTFYRHGARDPLFGVKVGDLKKYIKYVKNNHELALQLYDTGNSDAMYLAGLAVNPKQMSKETLQKWVNAAYWYVLAECTVAWVAAESEYALELAREWMESTDEMTACAGWSTYANYLSIAKDEQLNLKEIQSLLQKVEKEIHGAPNRVRYNMNQFVICVGSFVASLTEEAKATAEKIGKVHVDVGNTACKVPLAADYIEKVKNRGKIGVKKKTCRC